MKRGFSLAALLFATIASSIVTFYLGSHCGYQMGNPPFMSSWLINPHGPDPTNLGPRLYIPHPFNYKHWYTVSAFGSFLLGLFTLSVAQYFVRDAIRSRLSKPRFESHRPATDVLMEARHWYH